MNGPGELLVDRDKTMENTSVKQIEILVIEDEPVIQQTLDTFLDASGYVFEIADCGENALALLETCRPELILCDIMMPGMTGYQVCEKLKTHAELRKIPLIFLTALHTPEQLLKGFQVGAVDYITKPFYFPELEARIKTHLALYRGQRNLADYARRLEVLNQEKDQFLGIVAHDLKNPLSTILLRAQMTQMKAAKLTPEKLIDSMEFICSDAQRMLNIVSNLLDINRLEMGKIDLKIELMDIKAVLRALTEVWQEKAQVKNIEIVSEWNEMPVMIQTDKHLLFQILENLLSNALKYSPYDCSVWLEIEVSSTECTIHIRDQGPGLSPEDQGKLFQKFTRLSSRPTGGESSNGLGLSIVKYLAEQLQGRVSCQSQLGQGACFSLTLPLLEGGKNDP